MFSQQCLIKREGQAKYIRGPSHLDKTRTLNHIHFPADFMTSDKQIALEKFNIFSSFLSTQDPFPQTYCCQQRNNQQRCKRTFPFAALQSSLLLLVAHTVTLTTAKV